MSLELRRRLFDELDALVLIDPHTHINALTPAIDARWPISWATTTTPNWPTRPACPRSRSKRTGLDPKEKVGRLVANLGPIENTIQYSWFIEMCREFFGFEGDRVTADNWEALYDAAEEKMAAADWPKQVLAKSKLEAVFLTNDFDDPLEGFDTKHLHSLPADRRPGVSPGASPRCGSGWRTLRARRSTTSARSAAAIGTLFEHFNANGARACAISLPPDFAPTRVSRRPRRRRRREASAREGRGGRRSRTQRAAANFVFWTLAEYCAEYQSAVRFDDRRQPRRLRRRRVPGPGPVRQPRLADPVQANCSTPSRRSRSRFRCWPASPTRN